MANDIKQIIHDTAKETAQATAETTRREFKVLTEDLEKNIVKAMKEELDTHGQQIRELLTDMEVLMDDVGEVKDDVAAIKVGVGATEGEKPLKQRVEGLEAKAK